MELFAPASEISRVYNAIKPYTCVKETKPNGDAAFVYQPIDGKAEELLAGISEDLFAESALQGHDLIPTKWMELPKETDFSFEGDKDFSLDLPSDVHVLWGDCKEIGVRKNDAGYKVLVIELVNGQLMVLVTDVPSYVLPFSTLLPAQEGYASVPETALAPLDKSEVVLPAAPASEETIADFHRFNMAEYHKVKFGALSAYLPDVKPEDYNGFPGVIPAQERLSLDGFTYPAYRNTEELPSPFKSKLPSPHLYLMSDGELPIEFFPSPEPYACIQIRISQKYTPAGTDWSKYLDKIYSCLRKAVSDGMPGEHKVWGMNVRYKLEKETFTCFNNLKIIIPIVKASDIEALEEGAIPFFPIPALFRWWRQGIEVKPIVAKPSYLSHLSKDLAENLANYINWFEYFGVSSFEEAVLNNSPLKGMNFSKGEITATTFDERTYVRQDDKWVETTPHSFSASISSLAKINVEGWEIEMGCICYRCFTARSQKQEKEAMHEIPILMPHFLSSQLANIHEVSTERITDLIKQMEAFED